MFIQYIHMINKYKHMFMYLDILNLLFLNYDSLINVREIARKLHLNPATSSLLVKELIDLGLIKYIESGRSKILKLNTENAELLDFLSIAEIMKKIRFVEQTPFKHFFKMLEEDENKDMIAIFGSYARGNYSKDSDLDLIIVSDKNLREELPTYLLPIKIHNIQMTKEMFLENLKAGNEVIKEIVKNHIIIKGVEVFLQEIIKNYGN